MSHQTIIQRQIKIGQEKKIYIFVGEVCFDNRLEPTDLGVTHPDYQRLLETISQSFRYIKSMEYNDNNVAILLQ